MATEDESTEEKLDLLTVETNTRHASRFAFLRAVALWITVSKIGRAVAMILRCHICRPADVVNGGESGGPVEDALAFSRAATSDETTDGLIAWSEDPASWKDENEDRLQRGIQRAVVNLDAEKKAELSDLTNTIGLVHDVDAGVPLNRSRNSFDFEQSNL